MAGLEVFSVFSAMSSWVAGMTADQILAEYPGLSQEDIQACLLFATRTLKDTDFMPLAV